MGIEVLVASKFSRRVRRNNLKMIALRTLASEGMGANKSLSIVVTDDSTIRDLNRRHLKIDAPTDVLSYSAGDDEYLGDIVISFETAKRNANGARWGVGDELSLLVVHGLLHLLGYDDSTPPARNRMWKKQEQILGPIPVNDARSSKPSGRIPTKPS